MLTNVVSVFHCSAARNNGIFSIWQLAKFLFPCSDEQKIVVKVLICETDVKLVLHELVF